MANLDWDAGGKLTRDARSTSDPRARSAYLDKHEQGNKTKEGPGRAVERGGKKKAPLAEPKSEGGEAKVEKRTSALPRAVEVPTTQRLSQAQEQRASVRDAPSVGDSRWWSIASPNLNQVGDSNSKPRAMDKETHQRKWYILYVVREAVEKHTKSGLRARADDLPKILEACIHRKPTKDEIEAVRAATPLRGGGGQGLWSGISTREPEEIAKGLIKCKPTHFKAVRILTRSDYLFSVCTLRASPGS